MTATEASVFSAILTLTIVALVVWWAVRAERRAKAELAWPTVEGLVSHSEVKSGKVIKPKIAYTYAFDGQQYVGNVVQSNMVLYSGAQSPQRLCARFPVGSRPRVSVDRDNPRRAVLIPGGDRTFLYFVLGIAAFFLLTNLAVFVAMILAH